MSAIDRVGLPADDFAERMVIGSLFANEDPGLFDRIAACVDESMFHSERNKLAFAALRSLCSRGVTPTSARNLH